MNDYEYRCLWEESSYSLKNLPVYNLMISDDPDLGVKAINLVEESPYGTKYNFIKTNG